MTTERRLLGNRGEELAARLLMRKGYTLLARNWTFGHLEIDIVADWFGEIVFVEVKTRTAETVTTALEAVDAEKQDRLLRAAQAYLRYHRLDAPFRFDVITVVGTESQYELRHYERAFSGGAPEGVKAAFRPK